jgi:hypothetical protein
MRSAALSLVRDTGPAMKNVVGWRDASPASAPPPRALAPRHPSTAPEQRPQSLLGCNAAVGVSTWVDLCTRRGSRTHIHTDRHNFTARRLCVPLCPCRAPASGALWQRAAEGPAGSASAGGSGLALREPQGSRSWALLAAAATKRVRQEARARSHMARRTRQGLQGACSVCGAHRDGAAVAARGLLVRARNGTVAVRKALWHYRSCGAPAARPGASVCGSRVRAPRLNSAGATKEGPASASGRRSGLVLPGGVWVLLLFVRLPGLAAGGDPA